MFLYKNLFFSISILSIPIMLIGINGGYFAVGYVLMTAELEIERSFFVALHSKLIVYFPFLLAAEPKIVVSRSCSCPSSAA